MRAFARASGNPVLCSEILDARFRGHDRYGGNPSAQIVEKRPDEAAQLVSEMPPSVDRCRTLDDDFPDCIGVGRSLALVDLLRVGGTLGHRELNASKFSADFESSSVLLGSFGEARSRLRSASETFGSK